MTVLTDVCKKTFVSLRRTFNNKANISNLNNVHPKQIIAFDSYRIFEDTCICSVAFDATKDNVKVYKEVEFNLEYPTTEENILRTFDNMKRTASFREYKDIKNVKVNNAQKIENNKRIFLFVYNIFFNYQTKRGTEREDIRIIISEKKIDDIGSYFMSEIDKYNLRFPYRKLLNISLKKVEETSIADIKVLTKLAELEAKERDRIIINNSNEGVIVLNQISTQYKTDRGKTKTSKFILPLAGYIQTKKLTNLEVESLINQNKQRKVSNVKILDTKALTFIKL